MLDSSNKGSRRKPEKLHKQHWHVPVNPSIVLTTHSYMEVVGGGSVSYHWVALRNFHWLVATDFRNENQSLYPGKSQAWTKSLGGIRRIFSPAQLEVSSTEKEWIWTHPQVLKTSYCRTYTLTYAYIPLHNHIDHFFNCYIIAATVFPQK